MEVILCVVIYVAFAQQVAPIYVCGDSGRPLWSLFGRICLRKLEIVTTLLVLIALCDLRGLVLDLMLALLVPPCPPQPGQHSPP